MEPLVVTEAHVEPHGLRCMDCDRELTVGMPYSQRLVAFVDDSPIVEAVCVGCAVAA